MSFEQMLQEFGSSIQKEWQATEKKCNHFAVTVKQLVAQGGNDGWQFTEGATSYPVNLFAALVQLASLQGAMGEHMYQTARLRQAILGKILSEALHHKEFTLSLMAHFILTHPFKITGKFMGSLAANTFILNRLKLTKLQVGAFKVGGFLLSSYGAAQLGISYGLVKVEQIIPTILSGYPQFLAEHLPEKLNPIQNSAELEAGLRLLEEVRLLNEKVC